ncbi:3-isopropylmalate dehydratase large subunit [Novosphingobium sp. SG707]|uniref:3-isopropylmalate dehydratase large subunit n=1 Tax=Novosphingobium sp. SG707 TaxID=2586996 RepID=UPI0014476B05|nr:3-isopropylmalate dehydratase large subunit [Novosphingobium sp. SG707]NKJ00968.1 3-isopropylmalate/(R)-2-methylmalate dehydratase large subunit [Novosphingobium sp. SG707]
MTTPRSLFAKLWDQHRIARLDDGAELLYLDRIILHDRSGPPALRAMARAHREVLDPYLVFGTLDHVVDTTIGRTDRTLIPSGQEFIRAFREETGKRGISLFDMGDARQGIAHVAMPEQGIALPGLSLVCADSHTGTVGGIGALAWGIGISEMEHALVTQTLALKRPKTMRIIMNGQLASHISAKDLVLHLIGQIGANGGVGYMAEFAGDAVTALDIEGRMTLCNMGVEFGAWSAIVAPDETTFAYFAGRPFAPRGAMWDHAVAHWRTLRSDDDAIFDRDITLDVSGLAPQITWGTSPQHVINADGHIPYPEALADPVSRQTAEGALRYMGLTPGQALCDIPVDAVFIGSCTNARIGDLRAAAAMLRGRKIAPTLKKAIVVPGSSTVKLQAQAEGLDAVFTEAGFEWRESGCSLCFFGGGETFPPGARVASTTNRNFENRQGPGIRTHLMSPATAAAAAITGTLADPRRVAS